MNKNFKKKFQGIVFFLVMTAILIGLGANPPIGAAGAWSSIDGGGSSGINTATANYARFPAAAADTTYLYVAWQEQNGTTDEVHIKKYNGSWTPSGSVAGQTKLNSSATNAQYPALAVYNGALYAAWQEYEIGVYRIHVKKFDGSAWTFKESYMNGDGRVCINHNTSVYATEPTLAVFNGSLYAAWAEQVSGGQYQIRVSMFDGSYWSSVDGNDIYGLNKDQAKNAHNPSMTVYNNQLYIAWEEDYSSKNQLRVKRYDGPGSWVFVDYNGVTGLNYDTGYNVKKPVLVTYNGMLYAVWSETFNDPGYGELDLIHYKKYNGASWALDAGGWNKDVTFSALNPSCVVYNTLMYAAWDEPTENPAGIYDTYQIRSIKFDGSTPTFIDGNAATGMNYNTLKKAQDPVLSIFNGDLFAAWYEDYNGKDQIHVQKLLLPAITTSVTAPVGTYITGSQINITVTFNKAVTVTGTPYIPITLNTGGTVNASYVSGSTTASLVFRYTVAATNLDTNGITIGANISLNGGTIVASSQGAALNLNNIADMSTVLVDGVAPKVSSVSVPTNGTYKIGDNLDFTVTFDDNIAVVGTNSTLSLNIGGVTKNAAYLSSNTNSITYRYTVNAGDLDNNGIGVTGIILNTSTIKDTAGNNADLTLQGIGSTASVLVEAVAPVVSSVNVPANGTYKVTGNLDFTVNFNENITVTGTNSTLGLDIGGSAKNAAYLSNTTNSITYRYAVSSGDLDINGIGVTGVAINTSTIKDAAGNNANLTLNSVGSTTLVLVDGVAPLISSVSVPANGAYKTGSNLDFTVTFNDTVSVTGTNSTLSLDIGGVAKNAAYQTNTTTSITYRYIIQAGDQDTNGIAVTGVVTNTSTIRDAAGNDADLTLHGVGNTASVLVDAVAPLISSVIVPANGTYKVGNNLDFTVTFSENITVTGGGSTLTLDIGGVTKNASYQSNTATSISYRYTANAGDLDTNGISVTGVSLNTATIKDSAGNDADLTLHNVENTTLVLVDAIVPMISSVSVPGGGTYKIGDILDFTVTYNANITVVGTDSTLTLDFGGVAKNAPYQSKNVNSISYRYIVTTGDQDTNGISVTGIVLNTTIIRNTIGNNADLTLHGVGDTSLVLVDGIAPKVSSVSVPANATYKTTDNLDFIVTFDDNIVVVGTNSTLSLDIGGVTKNAAYLSSNTNSITYRYTVNVGDLDNNGIGVTGIILNTSTIKDTAGNNADLTLHGVGNTSSVLVDGMAPVVSSVSVPGGGTYKIGDPLDFTVTFNNNITVTGTDSTLGLDIGGEARNAAYRSKTVNSVTYRYTIIAGDQDTNGITVTGITLNSTTVTGATGNNANITLHSIGNTASVLVDGVAPVVSSVSVPANGAYRAGVNLDFTVNFSENLIVTGSGSTLSLVIGGVTKYAAYLSNAANYITYRYTVLAGDTDTDGIAVAQINLNSAIIRDTVGNNANIALNNISDTGNILVDTTEPTINSASLSQFNTYIDITFSEGIYGANDGTTPLTPGKLALTFTHNGGNTTNVQINSVKKTDNMVEGIASALTGGETTVRVFINVTGAPSGVETVEIKPFNSSSVFDRAGNAAAASETSGIKTLNAVNLSIAADQVLTETALDERSILVTLTGTSFADSALSVASFTLNNAPSGLSVESVVYADSNHCTVNLAFDGITPINSNITDLGLTISGTKLSCGSSLVSSNSLTIIAYVVTWKHNNIFRPGINGIIAHSAGNYRNEYSSVWDKDTLVLGKGVNSRIGDLWLYFPNIIGSGAIPADKLIDRAELILKIKNIAGGRMKPRQIKVYTISDPDNLGKPYFGSTDGFRTGLNFVFRDYRAGWNIPWKKGVANILGLFGANNPDDTFEFIPKDYYEDNYSDTIRLNVKAALQSWLAGTNQGLYITIGGESNPGDQIEFYGVTFGSNTNPNEYNNRPYLYVTYADAGGNVTPPAPVTINNQAVTPGNQNIVLNWTIPTGIQGTRVVRKVGGVPFNPDDGTLIYDGPGAQCTDTGLQNGKVYYYALFTYDFNRNYSSKVWLKGIPGMWTTVPAPPMSLNLAIDSNTGIKLTWTWTDTNPNNATGFIIERSPDAINWMQIATIPSGTNSYTDNGLQPGVLYYYQVKAVNPIGSSPSGGYQSLTLPLHPVAPAELACNIISANQVNLKWTDSPNETSYKVMILDESKNVLRTETLAQNAVQFTVTKLKPDTGYYFRVVAVQAGEEAFIESDLIKTPADPKPGIF